MTTLQNDLPATKPRIVLADDHAAMLENISSLVAEDFEIVATASDGSDVPAIAMRLCPDLIVLDVAMPTLDGFGTARELARIGCEAKIVFLTVQTGEEYVSAALALGASGYVLKSHMRKDLVQALRIAMQGDIFISRS